MLIFQLKTGRLSIVAGRGLCVSSKGGARGGGGGVLSPYNLAFHGPLSTGRQESRGGEGEEGGAGVKLGEILPWVTMGGGWGEEGQVWGEPIMTRTQRY